MAQKRTPKRKEAGLLKEDLKITTILQKKTRYQIDQMKSRSPIPKTDSQIIRYCVDEVSRSLEQKIIEKITEHDTKADWWREKLRFYKERKQEMQEA